ncbi:hypothetical protein [Haloarcula rubripromontorii]|uniref:hypothetical protein n=1 Tax=Haloarcula rubripromontorii TaxID=1705562 RepID=UPI000AEFB0FA|nr:hypothetical protein [Haloarcula rubripromontorii]
MTDDTSGAGGDCAGMTRRGMLALAGASAIAGCGSIGNTGGEPTIDAYDLPDIRRDEELESPVPPAVPVDVATSHFEAARERVHSLLATLPTPLGPDEVPNGHVRQHLTDAASTASDGLDEARTARTGLVALRDLRSAREHARYAAAGWSVVDRGRTDAPFREEHSRTVLAAREARQAHEYVGTDPVRAALVHARIETGLRRADQTDGAPRADSELLAVAEWGERAESAQAYLDNARHLGSQFEAALPADVGTLESVLADGAQTLLAAVRDRREALPPEGTAGDRTPGRMVLEDLRWEAESGTSSLSEAIGPASAVVDATGRLAQFRALERIGTRREADELARPTSAAAIRDIRRTARDALTAALESSARPELVRTILVDAGYKVMGADRHLSQHRGAVSVSALDRSVAGYWHATALARAAPPAARQAVQALKSG